MAAETTGDVHPPVRRVIANDKVLSHFGNNCIHFDPDLAGLDQLVGKLAESGRPVLRALYRERNQQGLGNKIIEPGLGSDGEDQAQCRERLGGLLRYYYRDAA